MLLQKRILFFSPPPVGVACYRGTLWLNSKVMLDMRTLEGIIPNNVPYLYTLIICHAWLSGFFSPLACFGHCT